MVEAIESDGNLYRQQYRPIVLNLARKKVRGIYEREKAVKLVIYLVDNGIKRHKSEFCEYYEVSHYALARIPATVKHLIATRLLIDMMPEIDYAVKEMKAVKKQKVLARRR